MLWRKTLQFIAVHPFQDGNGRMGRTLFILSLLQSSDDGLRTIVPYISIDRHIERHREEYYLVLRRCSEGRFLQNPNDYKIEYFLKFMLKIIEEAIKSDIDFYHDKHMAFVKLPQSQRKVLSIFKEHPEKKLSPKDISAEIKIPERTLLHALEKLIEKGFLQKSGTRPSMWYQLTFWFQTSNILQTDVGYDDAIKVVGLKK